MQASGLVPALAGFGINQLHTSDSRRCRDTVGPYASARSIAIQLEPTFSEERHKENPKKALARIAQLAQTNEALALCTHRPVIPTVMESLSGTFEILNPTKKTFDAALTPGSMVIFHRETKNLKNIHAVERHIH
jgi:8-oxo-dGTP diphosphatase